MKFVLDRYEVWRQGVFIDADTPEEAIEKAERGEGEDIESWWALSSRESQPVFDNVEPFDPERHELPVNHPYRKYLMLYKMADEQGIPIINLGLAERDPDDLLGMPTFVVPSTDGEDDG